MLLINVKKDVITVSIEGLMFQSPQFMSQSGLVDNNKDNFYSF